MSAIETVRSVPSSSTTRRLATSLPENSRSTPLDGRHAAADRCCIYELRVEGRQTYEKNNYRSHWRDAADCPSLVDITFPEEGTASARSVCPPTRRSNVDRTRHEWRKLEHSTSRHHCDIAASAACVPPANTSIGCSSVLCRSTDNISP